MKDNLLSELSGIYGKVPAPPEHLDVRTNWSDCSFAGGAATLTSYTLLCLEGAGAYSFPALGAFLSSEGSHPVIIHLDYELVLPSRYTPCEEILDLGYSVLQLSRDGLLPSGRQNYNGTRKIKQARGAMRPGSLALYAYGIMRAVDMLYKTEYVDRDRIYVIGQGELGEAALLAAALDGRIRGVSVSGLSGISSSESGLWCRGYLGNEDECERIARLSKFIAPRRALVCFSEGDEPLGDVGALADIEGLTVYHRKGGSYLSRYEWQLTCREMAKSGKRAVPC